MLKIRKYKDFKINQKLLLSFMLLIIIPVTLVSAVSYGYSTRYLESRVAASFKAVNVQITENMDTFLRSLARVTETPYFDYEIWNIMEKDYSRYEYPQHEKIQDYKKIIEGFFSGLLLLNDYIDSLYLYHIDTGITYSRGYYSAFSYNYSPQSKVVERSGKELIKGIHNKEQGSTSNYNVVTVERTVVKPYTKEQIGVFGVNVKVERLKGLYREVSLIPGMTQLIVDENNRIIFSNEQHKIGSSLDPDVIKYINTENIYSRGKLNGHNVFLVTNTSQYTLWKVISIIPEKDLFKDIRLIKNLTVISSLVLIILSVIISSFIARGLSTPIKKLSSSIEQVEKGDLNTVVDMDGNDEISHLGRSFNRMVKEIKALMEKTLINERRKRTAELNALQYQINPHFMYNTLNVIKWMAKMQAADNITSALDSFTSILKFSVRTGEEFISIKDEIEFIKNYVSILQLRYYNKFTVEYNIMDNIYSLKTLKFILQPIVENAVFHAFKKKGKKYVLKIGCMFDDNSVLFRVSDNGEGMDEKSIISALNVEESALKGFNSIGLKNIYDRVKLHFGDEYGLQIQSELGMGTVVTVRIPVLPLDQ